MVEQKMEKTYRKNCKRNCNEISQSIQEFSQKYAMNFGESPVICWVNDDLYADMGLRASLARRMGCDIAVMPSTEGALEVAAERNVVLYVSNMRRPGDSEAGITLLRKLRENGKKTPYVVFTSWSNLITYGKEIIKSGGQACEYYEEEFLAAVYAALEQAYGDGEQCVPTVKRSQNNGEKAVICWVNDDIWADERLAEAIANNVGAEIIRAASTNEAMEIAANNNCILFVSNMRRPGESDAGLALLKKLREVGNSVPYIVFTSQKNKARYKAQLMKNGASACVYYEAELITAVDTALKRRSAEICEGGEGTNNFGDVEEFVY